ncbi:MAG: hypothetical protein LBV00_00875 [Propionibacteriaceae bacterium]|jgi:hypothetical protein|nr:hypothetical protein [Propionibacteriaceae bacterium]
MTGTPTVENIQGSVAFRSAYAGLTQTFGPSSWQIKQIYPWHAGNDFVMSVILRRPAHTSSVVYINGVNTLFPGMPTPGPGAVSICVPTPWSHISQAPDGAWVTAVERIVGTEQERRDLHLGASAERNDDVLAYVAILKRYLDQRPGA